MKWNALTTWQSGNNYDYYHDRSGHARRSDHAVNGDDKTVQVSRWNFKDSQLIAEKRNRPSFVRPRRLQHESLLKALKARVSTDRQEKDRVKDAGKKGERRENRGKARCGRRSRRSTSM